MSRVCLALVLLATAAYADIYLHNPRGSNNRLDDENRDRNNGNRLFDSQNNNRGGYNVGSVYYYEGSIVPMEWTAQHSCGNPNNFCEVIVQYMCDARLRDGTTSNTIPTNLAECYDNDCDTDTRYGRHESFDWYKQCTYRERNKGLFNANQKLNGDSAQFTRQNPAGTRRGYECPEERDYYPYWHPSPWIDVAVLTNQPRRCEAYKAESQNVKSRWYCRAPEGWIRDILRRNRNARGFIPITQEGCEALSFKETVNITRHGEWVEHKPWGVAAPVCRENAWSRDNHLGNSEGGYPNGFNWTVPADFIHEQCVMRVRYNISTNDFNQGAEDTANFDGHWSVQSSSYLNASLNYPNGQTNRDPALVDVWSKFRLTRADQASSFDRNRNNNAATLKDSREYVWKDNPKVDVFGSLLTGNQGNVKLQLAINTNQFGRTFQDRSHRFGIRSRAAAGLEGVTIHNLQVKGKRGNIVQTFPGTEYDFHPQRLEVKLGDYIHFQWTGSNTNPNNNAGQGRQGSDRSNVISLRELSFTKPNIPVTNPPTSGHWATSFPARIDKEWPFLGFSQKDIRHLAILDTQGGQYGGEQSELDDAGTYFDLGPRRATRVGIYHYLCTRNNNFSNRDQKGKIVVSTSTANTMHVGWAGGMVTGQGRTALYAPQGALVGLHTVTVENVPSTASDAASDFVIIQPATFNLDDKQRVTVHIEYEANGLADFTAYRGDTMEGPFEQVSASFDSGTATIATDKGGVFYVESTLNAGKVAGVVIGCLFAVAAIGGGVWFWRKKRAGGGKTTNSV